MRQVPKQEENKQTTKICFVDKYEVKGKAGEGSNAIVKLIIERSTGTKLAMKSFKAKEHWPSACTEAQILSKLHHENIIRFEKLFKCRETIHMIVEYFEGSTLFDLARKRHKFSEEDTKYILVQILRALNHCHESGRRL